MNYRFTPTKDKSKVILFLHGWGGSVDSFAFFEYACLKNFSTLNVDMPGFGASSEPSRPYSVEDYAIWIKHLLDELGINEVIIICHSFGGRVAVKFNMLFSGYVNGIIFIDSAGLKQRFNLRVWINKKRFKIAKFLAKIRLYKKENLAKFGSSDYKSLDRIMKETFVRVISEDLSKEYRQVKCRSLIIWGRSDRDTPMYMAKKINRLVKGSKLITLTGGHFAYIENKYRVQSLINKFLGELYE